MEDDDLDRRRHRRKTTSMEDDLNGIQSWQKVTLTEGILDGSQPQQKKTTKKSKTRQKAILLEGMISLIVMNQIVR